MITWDDGVTSESLAGRERGLRRQRERAVAELVKARREARWARLFRWVVLVAALASLVAVVVWPGPFGVLGTVSAFVAATLTWFDLRPEVERQVVLHRERLEQVQREYDAVFARLAAEEQQ